MFRTCGGFTQLWSKKGNTDEDDDLGSTSSEDDNFEEFQNSLRSGKNSTERYVLEIVGVLGLATLADEIDSFCVVSKVNSDGKSSMIHRTKRISHDTAPIWTFKTNSICFFDIDKSRPGDKIRVELFRKTVHIPGMSNEVSIGAVDLSYPILLANGDSSRREYCVAPEQYPEIHLALRFRKASSEDWQMFQELQKGRKSNIFMVQRKLRSAKRQCIPIGTPFGGNVDPTVWDHADHAGDVDFEFVTQKDLLGNSTTVLENGKRQKAYKVWPYPDPDNVQQTKFMTKAKLKSVAMDPSRNWTEASGGQADYYGSIFLEVLGCDDLPNMDTELVDGLTDAFVACVFEDNFVRTAVIHDSLNPRWMPWCHRAFEFHIQHPSSLLMLGVFDYDEGPIASHDPIGRVVIVPTLFERDTVYTLKYPLHFENKQRGTLTIRLRIHWHNPADASKAQAFLRPPRFIINVRSSKAWKVLRFITRGETDLSDVTIETIKLYATEIKEHWQRYCYFLDVVAQTLLWRGRTKLFGV